MPTRLRPPLPALCWLLSCCSLAPSCLPTRDLDATTEGTPPSASGGNAGSAAGLGSVDAGGSGAAGGSTGGSATAGGSVAETAGGSAGGNDATPGGGGAGAGEGGEASAGADGGAEPPLTDLPHDLVGSPVEGVLTLTEVTEAGERVFRIVSPLATYAVTASSGTISTLDDRSGGNIVQWVGGSSKRARRAGIVTTPQPVMTTRVDEASFTARHVRLLSASSTSDWAWTWDFYPTQATLTITQAGGTYAFAFSGTPGDQLTSADKVVQASGVGHSAVGSLLADLSGPAEWAYLTDAVYGHSLFFVQHDDDDLPERYDAIGGDTATWVFGDGQSTRAQRRFSIGFLGSAVHSNVLKRVQFVINAIH